MVEVLRQYLSGADKAVQISRAAFVDKGTQPELQHNTSKIALPIQFSHTNTPVKLKPPYYPLLYSNTGVYKDTHFSLIVALKHRLWVLVRAPSLRLKRSSMTTGQEQQSDTFDGIVINEKRMLRPYNSRIQFINDSV